VPLECNDNDSYVVAAHSVVTLPGDANNLADLLNQDPLICPEGEITVYDGSPNSYLDTDVWNNVGDYLGNYEGWCVDLEHGIFPGVVYSCKYISSHGVLPLGLVHDPLHMPNVNWLVNQEYVGETSPGCGGVYTSNEVQQAIWELIDDETSDTIVVNECRYLELYNLALANGEGYMPESGDLEGIICDTVDPATCEAHDAQTTMFVFRGDRDETAWGQGTTFTDSSTWAMYIEASCPADPE